ncbi:MAG: GNAT family N-acetyltransferase [Candidatus Wallacebacter cryptica]|jgi:ribosomal-protein-alanine N-acetyltransferase
MVFRYGSVSDARQIAETYCEAFPESVCFFFKHKQREKLLSLLTSSFSLLLLTGSRALLVQDRDGKLFGYCIYTSPTSDNSRSRQLIQNCREIFKHCINLIRSIRFTEIYKLIHNGITMRCSTCLDQNLPRKCGRINSIAVSPQYRGLGIGTKLLAEVLAELSNQAVCLNVRPDNLPAKHLYQKAGFEQCGTTKDLQGSWLMMIRGN